jgi:hypothetical protein
MIRSRGAGEGPTETADRQAVAHDHAEKPNRVRTVEGDYAYVEREQSGRVPIADVQAAIDVLYRGGELRINKATLGHSNTAFVGAVLRELPDVEVLTRPQRVRISGRAS